MPTIATEMMALRARRQSRRTLREMAHHPTLRLYRIDVTLRDSDLSSELPRSLKT
jgi:hypothetical protein